MQVAFPSPITAFLLCLCSSFYNRAKKDKRFLDALGVLEPVSEGKIVVERPNQKLSGFAFCKKGDPSDLATERYLEI